MSELEPTRTYSNPIATDRTKNRRMEVCVMESSTKILRHMLDERGVEWWQSVNMLGCVFTRWYSPLFSDEVVAMENGDGELELFSHLMTPEQAIAATLGPTYKPNPVWEKWHKSLRHETVETVGDAVEQLMYEAIEFGGDMGPNGNTCNGIDEGDVLTSGFINEWIARFESTLGRDRCSYEQWREISNAVGDAMEYAHDRAIEHPDRADPLWSLDEYVNRILKVVFEGEATLGATDAKPTQAESSGTCHDEGDPSDFCCSECGVRMFTNTSDTYTMIASDGRTIIKHPNYCPNCGRRCVG